MKCEKIAIVGLGLIGGSMLKALQGFSKAEFYGIDQNEDVLEQARREGLISSQNLCSTEILLMVDLVIVCLPPDETLAFINQNQFKKDALITDVCGVKQFIYQGITNHKIQYIGGHPMAGKEASGYEASDAKLFHNASYLLTPTEHNRPEHLELLKQMIAHIGCGEAVITTPQEHDAMIAYTSQLMHVVAIALCDQEQLSEARPFSAGSLRDCTRVAKLDSKLWTRLFLLNQNELLNCIDAFQNSLDDIKSFLEKEDETGLEVFLKNASNRKKDFFALP